MKKIILWTTGFDCVVLVGNIKLMAYNPHSNDFILRCDRDTLKCIEPSATEYLKLAEHHDWTWLSNLPIQEIDMNNQIIRPTWKPNRYGQPADLNAFQHVTITSQYVILKVTAGGNSKEVFERYNPYRIPHSNKTANLKFEDSYLTYSKYLQQQKLIHHEQDMKIVSPDTKLFD